MECGGTTPLFRGRTASHAGGRPPTAAVGALPKRVWKSYLRAHWDVLAPMDFTTIDVWTRTGLVTYYLLFFMELATRRIHFAGLTVTPEEAWMLQIARNVTDAETGFLRGKKYLLMDCDTKFSEAFRVTLEQGGMEAVRSPPRSPNLAAHIERFNANPTLMHSCHG